MTASLQPFTTTILDTRPFECRFRRRAASVRDSSFSFNDNARCLQILLDHCPCFVLYMVGVCWTLGTWVRGWSHFRWQCVFEFHGFVVVCSHRLAEVDKLVDHLNCHYCQELLELHIFLSVSPASMCLVLDGLILGPNSSASCFSRVYASVTVVDVSPFRGSFVRPWFLIAFVCRSYHKRLQSRYRCGV